MAHHRKQKSFPVADLHCLLIKKTHLYFLIFQSEIIGLIIIIIIMIIIINRFV